MRVDRLAAIDRSAKAGVVVGMMVVATLERASGSDLKFPHSASTSVDINDVAQTLRGSPDRDLAGAFFIPKTNTIEPMGMYTEFYFRAEVEDGDVADWLADNINGDCRFNESFDSHPFFSLPRWRGVFIGGGAVYQESRTPIFRRKKRPGGPYGNELVLASSLKDYSDEIAEFVSWVHPHLDMQDGAFLGYSLYEDSCVGEDCDYRESPTLYFYEREAVRV